MTRPTLSHGRTTDGPSRTVTRSWRTTNMTDTGTAQAVRWLGLTEAATAMGVSVRTVQRRIKSGDLDHQVVTGGRVMVAVRPDTPRDGQATEELVHLRQQVDTTNRMTAALLAMAERDGQVLADRVRHAEAALVTARRRGGLGWTAAAVMAVTAGVAAGVGWTSHERLGSVETRLAESNTALVESAAAAAAARKDADHLREAVVVLTSDLADAMSGCLVD